MFRFAQNDSGDMFRGVYPERSRRAQNDNNGILRSFHSLRMTPLFCHPEEHFFVTLNTFASLSVYSVKGLHAPPPYRHPEEHFSVTLNTFASLSVNSVKGLQTTWSPRGL